MRTPFTFAVLFAVSSLLLGAAPSAAAPAPALMAERGSDSKHSPKIWLVLTKGVQVSEGNRTVNSGETFAAIRIPRLPDTRTAINKTLKLTFTHYKKPYRVSTCVLSGIFPPDRDIPEKDLDKEQKFIAHGSYSNLRAHVTQEGPFGEYLKLKCDRDAQKVV